MVNTIDTDRFSELLRSRSVNLAEQKILISRLSGSEQEQDLSEPVNCNGVGRVRRFNRSSTSRWPQNPLPIDPARKALAVDATDSMRAQVFQTACCNWRCWYCYVPFSLLSGNVQNAEWLSARELLNRYFAEPNRPLVIDLSGGQPDLTPEWVLWVMREIELRGLVKSIYLWSDDNLSNDYFWRFLGEEDRKFIIGYQMYGKVCCFKGFDKESFSFNTSAEPELFQRQFELMRRYVESGIDVYAYITLTTPTSHEIDARMSTFLDNLQEIHPLLPLRTVPLEVQTFSPVVGRMDDSHSCALVNQYAAVECWRRELNHRFSHEQRRLAVTEIKIGSQP